MFEVFRSSRCRHGLALLGVLLSLGACAGEAGDESGGDGPGSSEANPAAAPNPVSATTLRVVEHAGKPLLILSGGVVVDTGGKLPTTNGNDFLLARLAADGKVDSTFGQGGLGAFDFGPLSTGGIHDAPMAVAIAPDGKILLAGRGGQAGLGIGAAPAIARFLADGKPDPSFGQGGGVIFLPKGRNRSEEITFRAIALDEQGRIYVYGGKKFGPTWLLRFAADGSHDPAFGKNGDHIDPNVGTALGLVVTPNRLIAISNDFGVAAYTHEGVVDESFGKKGYIDGGEGQSTLSIRRADGTIVVAGVRFGEDSSESDPIKLLAFDEQGAPVSGFGMNGTALHEAGTAMPRGLAATPDGSIYLSYSVVGALHLMKLTPQGSLDASFGEGGIKKLSHRVSLVDLSEVNSNELGLVGDTVWMTINEISKTPSTILTAPVSR